MTEKAGRRKTAVIIAAAAAVVICAVLGFINYGSLNRMPDYFESGDYSKNVRVYNLKVSGNEEYEKVYNERIPNSIDDIVYSWASDKTGSEAAVKSLEKLKKIDNDEISGLAEAEIAYIHIEDDGDRLYDEAENHFTNGEYISALKSLSSIDKNYSDHDMAEEFYSQCRQIILASVEAPESVEEYDKCIETVEKCCEEISDPELENRKQTLKSEREDFCYAADIIRKAEEQMNNKAYRDSFDTLENGIENSSSNRFLNETLDEYHHIYVISVTEQTDDLLKKEDYEGALKAVEGAQEIYDCEEFDQLKDAVRRQQHPLYGSVMDLLDRFRSMAESDKGADAEGVISNVIKSHYVRLDSPKPEVISKADEKYDVKFELNRLTYKEGKISSHVIGWFPVFESESDISLPDDYLKSPEEEQEEYCNEKLKSMVSSDPELKKQFNRTQLKDIEKGRTPSDYVWHHNEEEGIMQLVNAEIHSNVPHTGGSSLWGV